MPSSEWRASRASICSHCCRRSVISFRRRSSRFLLTIISRLYHTQRQLISLSRRNRLYSCHMSDKEKQSTDMPINSMGELLQLILTQPVYVSDGTIIIVG